MQPKAPPVILATSDPLADRDDFGGLSERARSGGFNALLFAPADAPLGLPAAALVEEAARPGLPLLLDAEIDRFPATHPLVERYPERFALRRSGEGEAAVDPRKPATPSGEARARLRGREGAVEVVDAIGRALEEVLAAGARGLRFLRPDMASAEVWRVLLGGLRRSKPEAVFIAQTPGLSREAVRGLRDCGFDYTVSSLGWWDGRARWFFDEHRVLRTVAPPLADLTAAAGRGRERAGQLSGLAAATAAGAIAADAIVDDGFAPMLSATAGLEGELTPLTSAGAGWSAMLRTDRSDARLAKEAIVVLVGGETEARVEPSQFAHAAGLPLTGWKRADCSGEPFAPLAPHEVRLLKAERARPVLLRPASSPESAREAAGARRLVVENLSPSVEGGDFPVKRTVGERVRFEVDAFMDGHEVIAVELCWRALDEGRWRTARMTPLGNDRWAGELTLERMGRHEVDVEAWYDRFGTLKRDLGRKIEAGVAQPVDFAEGRVLIERAAKRSSGELAARLNQVLARLDGPGADLGGILLAPETAALMDAADPRPFSCRLPSSQLLDAERLAARFSSWYELFPRSQSGNPNRHGTFDDVIRELPRVRAMGFDTLYFPPIHPIGRAFRKGRNNTLTPGPDDPGSPYAIGSEAGGHDAIHPELGTLEDFRRLVKAAHEHGLEIALDFAIQCSPDHPWLKEHPGWFDWRPDGTIKYAENPPKKYQDIVNVDFYEKDAVPGLWLALRDVVLFWIEQGVKTFRVDNPHTKPFPFWEWMIAQVRSQHPEAIFLSEAFTRPKVMYRLAKIGFSQSYTYFTWRNSKAELTDYLTELTTSEAREFFRPNFFVNTPDINPVYLQTSGRAGFRVRAVLAATLSGLWGVYSGFELCEGEPMPGKEEYKDSEKYEIRVRDWEAPGNIAPDIRLLNRLRRDHPALQTHLGVTFLNAWNDNILYYARGSAEDGDLILVAVNLDPHGAHEADFEVPLWEFGLPDSGTIAVEDLVAGTRFQWTGKVQHLRLDPDQPYAIWRIEPVGAA